MQVSLFVPQLFHHALDQLFCVGQILHDELHVHYRLARPALALAIDAVLADEGHGIGDEVHGDCEPSTGHTHAGFEVFKLFLLFVENGHGEIVSREGEMLWWLRLAFFVTVTQRRRENLQSFGNKTHVDLGRLAGDFRASCV
jgi:hypothetical protein